ncbi:MAG: hypothetical protein IH859_02360 [Chloroflexi bacterium]|nr:hypothetical protein [Chloroflexota bacterium]
MKKSSWKDPNRQATMILLGAIGLYIYFTLRLGGLGIFDFPITMYGYIYSQSQWINSNVVAIVIDVAIFIIGGLIFWLAFFSQFVLPVKTLKERKEVAARLLAKLGSGLGPAVFVQDGKIIEDPSQKNRKGAGVIILDTASAAALHNQASFTRAVGPGLVFTGKNERIAGTIDLHTQVRRLGPEGSDEDPFAEKGEDESDENFQFRKERRLQTSALTRDGVEVVPNITAVFRLEAEIGEGNTRFGYDHDAVWRAVAFEGIDPDEPADALSRHIAWDWLPTHIASDLWREYLSKFTLNSLFEYVEIEEEKIGLNDRPTTIEYIAIKVNERLKKGLVDELDDVGKLTGRRIGSREHRFMRERGIKIINVGISNLRMENKIENKFVERWTATWLQRAEEEQGYITNRQSIEKFKGQTAAQKDFSDIVIRSLYERLSPNNEPTIDPPSMSESVELLVRSTLNGILRAPDLHNQLQDEEADLVELIEWLRKYSNDPARG